MWWGWTQTKPFVYIQVKTSGLCGINDEKLNTPEWRCRLQDKSQQSKEGQTAEALQ